MDEILTLPPQADIFGLILAGGRARRMAGANKALVALGGRPLLAHVVAALSGQCAALALSANDDPALYAAFGLPVLPDATRDFHGPLAGIAAGLAAAAPFSSMLSVSVDTPFLPRDLSLRLHEARGAADVAVAAAGGRAHWTSALWRSALAPDLAAALAAGARRAEEVVRRFSFVVVDVPVGARDPFFNVNSAADLREAERLIDAA